MKRNLLLLLFVFFLPAIVLIVNSVMIGQDPEDLPLAIVNLEGNCDDKSFLERCEPNRMGCYFQESLDQTKIVDLVTYSDITKAYGDTRNGELHGAIVVPLNFSETYLNKIQKNDRPDPEEKSVDEKQIISIRLDESDPLLEKFVKKAISEAVDDMLVTVSNLCEDQLGDGVLDFKMFKEEAPLLGYKNTSFREFVTPGMICGSLFFIGMALTSESFISERSQGLLERSWITGVLPIEIILSYILSQFVVMAIQVCCHLKSLLLKLYLFNLFQSTITLVIVFAAFQIPCRGPIFWLILLTLFQGNKEKEKTF